MAKHTFCTMGSKDHPSGWDTVLQKICSTRIIDLRIDEYMYRQTKNGLGKHWDFIIVDIFALELSLFLAYLIRNGGSLPMTDSLYRNLILFLPMLHLVVAFVFDNYSGILRRGYLKELSAVLVQCLLIAGFLLLYFFIVQTTDRYSRSVLILTGVFSAVLMYIGRILLRYVIKHMDETLLSIPYMLVVTPAAQAESVVNELKRVAYNRFRLSGVVYTDRAHTEGAMVSGVPVVADLTSYGEYMRQQVVDEIFIALKLNDPCLPQVILPIEETGSTAHLNIPSLFPAAFPQTVSQFGPYTAITSSPKLVTRTQLVLKRSMDIVSALIGLLATGIAFLFVAPIVKIQAPGPVFFSQMRVGKNGRPFKIYKFRSMYMDAEERKKELMAQNQMQGLMFKMENDPRIFPFGHFIRKASIDELPQFWNVLKGDMSLVGTRPPTLDEYKQYELHHKFRLAFKPGITGMWQVSGRSSITDFEDVVKLDSEYIRNWSIGLDIKIILKTVKVVLLREGAE